MRTLASILYLYGLYLFVSSQHKLQKFSSSGELIKCIGRRGSKEAEFDDPRGVTIHSNQAYVCDKDNHRIQVFDLDFNFIGSIGSRGRGRGDFDAPQVGLVKLCSTFPPLFYS